MDINFLSLKEKFNRDGYFICKNIFNKNNIDKLIDEINKSQQTVKYYDNFNNLRRITRMLPDSILRLLCYFLNIGCYIYSKII